LTAPPSETDELKPGTFTRTLIWNMFDKQIGISRTRLAVLSYGVIAMAGCGLGDGDLEQVDPGAVPASVTYKQHIQPRMEYYCVACHNPDGSLGNAGGWDLSNYKLVRAAYTSISEAAFTRRIMPPGGARKLTAEDVAIFRRWESLGFPEKP
jgi:hypothetical protein